MFHIIPHPHVESYNAIKSYLFVFPQILGFSKKRRKQKRLYFLHKSKMIKEKIMVFTRFYVYYFTFPLITLLEISCVA